MATSMIGPGRLISLMAVLLCGFLPRVQAQGAPPFSTNDPDTPGPGRWEINVLGVAEHRPGERVLEAPILDLNYGVGERVQLSCELSRLSVRAAGEPPESGLSNAVAGVKWRFRDGGERGASVSLYPQVEFNTPGSPSRRKGIVDSDTAVTLPFQAKRDFELLSVTAEVGRVVHLHRTDEWFGGCAVGHAFSRKLELGVELYSHATDRLARSDLLLNLGVHIAVDDRNGLVLGLGRELHNHFERRTTVVGLVGWQFLR
jgi:hypothetical protein